MLRRAWKPVAATTVLIGAPASLYYYNLQRQLPTFDINIKVRGADGKSTMATKSFQLQSAETINKRITENAKAETNHRPDGVVWKHTTAFLSSNDPIEDANSYEIIQRDASDPSAPGDLLFYAVMDGHAGYHTSRLLSQALIKAVALELSNLINNPEAVVPKSSALRSTLQSLWTTTSSKAIQYDANPEHFSLAIQNAFTKFDTELVNAPVNLLMSQFTDEERKKNIIPDLSKHPMAMTMMRPAMSGIRLSPLYASLC